MAGMRGADLAPGLVVQFLLFQRLDLGLGEDNALFGGLGLERFQPRLEVSQVVAKPDAARPLGDTNTPRLRSSLLTRTWLWAGYSTA